MNLKNTLLIAFGLLLFVCGGGALGVMGLARLGAESRESTTVRPDATRRPTFTPYPTSTPDDPAESSGAVLTVNAYTLTESVGTLDLDEGNTFLLLDVTVTNTAFADELSYSVFDFTLTDGEGYQYLTSFSPVEPALHSGDLATGEKGRGFVVFEIPAAAANLILHFEPFELNEQGSPLRLEAPLPPKS